MALRSAGREAIEVGVPFSDPIADGPVIQEAFTAALAEKTQGRGGDGGRSRRQREDQKLPLAAMISYSIVFRHGVTKFLAEAKEAGFAGLILPDLPPPEAQKVCGQVRAAGLDTILLIAPTTPLWSRRKEIVKLCSGFVYYLSVSGITGERDRLPDDLVASVREIKGMTDLPVCVGFGIHKLSQVKELGGVRGWGTIVGTAIVRRMKEHLGAGAGEIAGVVGGYVRELTSPPA